MRNLFEYWIGSRYVRSRSSNSFVSLISAISMLGIAIAVSVLIVVMSVVNGFERELKDRLLAMTSHATIEGINGELADPTNLIQIAIKNPRVAAAAPFVEGQALLVFERQISGAQLRGIDPDMEDSVSGIGGVMQSGELGDLRGGDFNIVLGVELADAMQVGIGEKVTVTLAEGRVTPAGVMPRTKRFTVSGIYRVGMYEFDRRLAFINMRDAQKLYRLRDNVSGVRLAVTDIYNAPAIVREVALENGELVYVDDWTHSHNNFFRSIQITKSILFVILLMVIGVVDGDRRGGIQYRVDAGYGGERQTDRHRNFAHDWGTSHEYSENIYCAGQHCRHCRNACRGRARHLTGAKSRIDHRIL
jgi:lipoprotein-releasing system permease protein